MTETGKAKLLNVSLVITLVLAVALVLQAVRRGMNVRREQARASSVSAPIRTFPKITVPYDAVKDLLAAINAGDHDAAINRIACLYESTQREAEAVYGAPCVWMHFEKVARQVFGNEAPPSAPGTQISRLTRNIEQSLKNSRAQELDTNHWQLVTKGDILCFLVNLNGDWKLDYDQTRTIAPCGMTVAEIEQTIARSAMLREVTADMQAGRFKSYADVEARLFALDSRFPVQLAATYPPARTPTEAVNDFISAVSAGDADALFNRMYFEDDFSRRSAIATMGLTFATQRFLTAAAEQFGNAAPRVDPGAPAAVATAMREEIRDSHLKIEGDLAEFVTPSGKALSFRRVDDANWKVDYATIQYFGSPLAGDPGLARPEIDTRCARYQAMLDMVPEIRGGRYSTFTAADAELQRRTDEFFKEGRAQRRLTALDQVHALKTAVWTFEIDNGRLPTQDEGLDALVQSPPGLEFTWRQLYETLPLDPWGRPYHYLYPRPDYPENFDILSAGPDGAVGTDDDIHMSTQE